MGTERYTVVIEWDPEEELFVATVPTLSVGSYGATRREALDNTKEAAELTIDGLKKTGQPVPTAG
jgi:predicted RNase H-like HicB family nuclease